MTPERSATLVVPCFNEAQRLDVAQFDAFARQISGPRLLFVNDGSTDATAELLAEFQHRHASTGRIDVLNLEQNGGKAEAVRQGLMDALLPVRLAKYQTEFVGYFDADLATPLDEIPRMLDIASRRQDIKIIVGSRMRLLGHRVQRTRVRKILGKIFAFGATASLNIPLRDTQCGAKLFRVSPALANIVRQRFDSQWLFDLEILARLRCELGCDLQHSIYEYPLEAWRDVAGSKLRPWDFATAPLELAQIAWKYRSGRQLPPAVGGSEPISVAAVASGRSKAA